MGKKKSMSKKDEYLEKLQTQLDGWKEDIEKLKVKADKAEADVKARYGKQVDELKVKQEAAKKKLDELKHSSEDAWEELKTGIDKAWHDLRDGVKSAASKFK